MKRGVAMFSSVEFHQKTDGKIFMHIAQKDKDECNTIFENY